jgi:hypothetical protein
VLVQCLILGWCQSQRDLVVVMSLVNQVIAAYAFQGGTTIVVMTQREKLEMEDLFRCVGGVEGGCKMCPLWCALLIGVPEVEGSHAYCGARYK